MIVGVCSRFKEDGEAFNHETASLIEEGKELFDDVVVIQPYSVTYGFVRGEDTLRVRRCTRDIGEIDLLPRRPGHAWVG